MIPCSPPSNTLLDALLLFLKTEPSISPGELSFRAGVETTLLLDTIFGVTPITKISAHGLATIFGGTERFWLNRQLQYDAYLDAITNEPPFTNEQDGTHSNGTDTNY